MAPRSGGSLRACALAVTLLAAIAPPARAAELPEGAAAYARRDYARARAVFGELAELGHPEAQYRLGAMALAGEGGPTDRGEAAGWMLAARENGHDPAPAALDALRASLGEGERAAADAIVARFGRAALEAKLLPARGASKPGPEVAPPRYLGDGTPVYPWRAGLDLNQAIVVVRGFLGVDGRLRDPEIVLSVPPRAQGGAPFVDSVLRSLLARRYAPATAGGKPVAVTYDFQITFVDQETAPDRPRPLALAQLAAGAGDPRAGFLVGLLGMQPRCATGPCPEVRDPDELVLAAAQAGVPEAQLFVGRQLSRARETAKALVWLERASRAGLGAAHVAYALELLRTPEPPYDAARALLARAAASGEPAAFRRAVAALACSPDPKLRSPADALALSRRVPVADEPDPLLVEAIAAARAGTGDFAGARDAERRAIRRAREYGWDTAAMQRRLDAYAARKAWTGELVPPPADEPIFPRPAS